jgi:hypothetical protein
MFYSFLSASFSFEWQSYTFPVGVLSTLTQVVKNEGFRGLYKGNGAQMVRIFPYSAIQFVAYEQYRKVSHD